jgi:hypothetical protein
MCGSCEKAPASLFCKECNADLCSEVCAQGCTEGVVCKRLASDFVLLISSPLFPYSSPSYIHTPKIYITLSLILLEYYTIMSQLVMISMGRLQLLVILMVMLVYNLLLC